MMASGWARQMNGFGSWFRCRAEGADALFVLGEWMQRCVGLEDPFVEGLQADIGMSALLGVNCRSEGIGVRQLESCPNSNGGRPARECFVDRDRLRSRVQLGRTRLAHLSKGFRYYTIL